MARLISDKEIKKANRISSHVFRKYLVKCTKNHLVELNSNEFYLTIAMGHVLRNRIRINNFRDFYGRGYTDLDIAEVEK